MLTLEETEQALTAMVDALPEEIFFELNGGVLLKEESKLHPARRADDLYILGEYYADRIFGRYIVIYYGSMRRVFQGASDRSFRSELEQILKHELTHHLENRAGERDLEFEDERQLLHYYARHRQGQDPD
ncbi:MAG: hypothetical protein GX819_05560 [Clostridiaceae bacterium]|jgi:hypothetical protein|nr:hypothetical protein [Clostridiaceae bacterium]